ncbi:MAG: AsmA-like C-terminal domain-containing protein [Myxococcota bacterium]
MRRALTRTLIAMSLFLAAAAVGYFLSSSLGQEIVREEIESQLSRLMQGTVTVENARVVARLGLRLEGENVEVYPGPSGPGLSARRVDAVIDVFSLLLGRFRLDSLRVDDLVMRAERNAEGRWSPHPLAILQDRDHPEDDLERHLALLHSFEAVARALLEESRVADLVVLRNARVELVDWLPRGPRQPPLKLSLESVRATWDHRWYSTDSEIAVRGVLVDDEKRRTSVEAEGRQLGGGRLHWTVAATDLPLDIFRPYARLVRAKKLIGRLSGVVAFETTGPDSDSLELDWVLWNGGVAVPWRDASARIEGDRVGVNARIELRPGRVRLAEATIAASPEVLQVTGAIERPIRESSRTRLSIEIDGMELGDLRDVGESLPPVDRGTFSRILEPFASGSLRRVYATARGRLSTWTELQKQRRLTLPPGFLIGAEVEKAELVLGAEPEDVLTEVGGVIEWSGDRLQTRNLTALWREEPLPRASMSIEGISNIFVLPETERRVRAGAAPVPGIAVLGDWLRGLGDEGGAPVAWPPMHFRLHALHHPAVFWPLRDVDLVLRLQPDGLDLALQSGYWAGAPVRGEAVLTNEPDRSFSVSIIASPPPEGSPPRAPAEPAGSTPAPWLSARFDLGRMTEGPLAFESLRGDVVATEGVASLTDVRVELAGGGHVEGRADLDLTRDDRVPADVSAQLLDGDVARLSRLFGLEEGTATGRVKLVASLHGPLVPGEKPWATGSGHLSLDARDGEIRRRMPVVVAMAQATEGFNPFSAREAVTYESIRTDFVLDEGVLKSDEFRLEGPMRVFASGSLDLRPDPPDIDAVIGVFLLRQADQLLGKVPIVNWLISDKGMVGAYFALTGPISDPAVDTLQVKTLTEQTPDIIKAPFRVLKFLLLGRGNGKR